jgi:hypothetical protein
MIATGYGLTGFLQIIPEIRITTIPNKTVNATTNQAEF